MNDGWVFSIVYYVLFWFEVRPVDKGHSNLSNAVNLTKRQQVAIIKGMLMRFYYNSTSNYAYRYKELELGNIKRKLDKQNYNAVLIERCIRQFESQFFDV